MTILSDRWIRNEAKHSGMIEPFVEAQKREGCISYGLSLTPLLRQAKDLIALAQQLENERRDRLFIRKQILAKLAYLESQGSVSDLILETRKTLRRKLNFSAYQAILAQLCTASEDLEIEDPMPKATNLPANNGQTVRHHMRVRIQADPTILRHIRYD